MKEAEQIFYYKMGDNYWWLRGKYNLIIYLIKKFCKFNIKPEKENSKIIDIGTGPGNMLKYLSRFGEIYGNDISPHAIKFCREKGFSIIKGNVDKDQIDTCGLKFNLVTLIDIIEHLNNDVEALERVKKMLVSSGQVVISVPAYQFLWGYHDKIYGHKRRYTKKELNRKLIKAGFKINKISYFQPLFLIPLYLFRLIKRNKKNQKDDFIKMPKSLNILLLKLIEIEKYYLRFFNFPFGATIIAIAQKDENKYD